MNLFQYIILSLALSVEVMAVVSGCAAKSPIRLTRGLALSALLAVVHAVLFAIGLSVGYLLRFDDVQGSGLFDDVNGLIYLGLMIFVAVKLLPFKKRHEQPAYNISCWSTSISLSIALGINVLLVGIALGFREVPHFGKACTPLAIVMLLVSYLAVMLGRQKKTFSHRRWSLLAVLYLLLSTIFYVVEY